MNVQQVWRIRNFSFKILRPMCKWEDNFKVDFIDTFRRGVHWARQAQDSDK